MKPEDLKQDSNAVLTGRVLNQQTATDENISLNFK